MSEHAEIGAIYFNHLDSIRQWAFDLWIVRTKEVRSLHIFIPKIRIWSRNLKGRISNQVMLVRSFIINKLRHVLTPIKNLGIYNCTVFRYIITLSHRWRQTCGLIIKTLNIAQYLSRKSVNDVETFANSLYTGNQRTSRCGAYKSFSAHAWVQAFTTTTQTSRLNAN